MSGRDDGNGYVVKVVFYHVATRLSYGSHGVMVALG